VRLKPAQVHPLAICLAGRDPSEVTVRFCDIVEAVYVATWPLVTNRPLSVRNLPKTQPTDREAGRRIVTLARRWAKEAASSRDPEAAAQEAIWALVGFLLHVVPSEADQCRVILEMIEHLEPPQAWSGTPGIQNHLYREVSRVLRECPVGTYRFSLERPTELHQRVGRMLELAEVVLTSNPDMILPVFPTVLAALTLDASTFTPLIRTRDAGNRIEAFAEIWDHTPSLFAGVQAFLSARERLGRARRASRAPCAAERFYREYVQGLKEFFQSSQQHHPALTLAFTLQMLPRLIKRHLAKLWNAKSCACPYCRITLKDLAIVKAGAAILSSPDKARLALASKMEQYEAWLVSSGLDLMRRRTGWPKPVCAVAGVGQPFLWRPLETPKRYDRPATSVKVFMGRLAQDGYTLTSKGEDADAVFLPALNQIWALESADAGEMAALLAHELGHAGSVGLQPAMLHPLRNHLMGIEFRPSAREFRDIAESVLAVLMPLHAGQLPTEESLLLIPKEYRALALGYLRLARKLARHPPGDGYERVGEALHAIVLLMLHIVPFARNQAAYVLKLLAKCRTPKPWIERYDLFLQLHRELAECCQRLPRARDSFLVTLPIDTHRAVGDMLMFLDGGLRAAAERREQLIGTIPTMLGVLTLGSLYVLPVITIRRTRQGYRARIGVTHSTSRSEPPVAAALEVQARRLARSEAGGVPCQATALMIEILEQTKPFRTSKAPERMGKCLRSLLAFLPAAVTRAYQGTMVCEGCKATLGAPTVRGAAQHVMAMPPAERAAFLAAAGGYESWLQTTCMEWAQQRNELDDPLHAVRAYRYL